MLLSLTVYPKDRRDTREGYLNSGILTETVGDEDGIAGGAGEGMARNGMGRMIGSCERDDL